MPPMCKENALLDKGLSTREAKIRLRLMKRVTRGERSGVNAMERRQRRPVGNVTPL